MENMKHKGAIGNKGCGQVIEMTPDFGGRVLRHVEDRIIYAFTKKRRTIKSLANEHGCKQGEIEEIFRERLAGQKLAA